VQSAKFDPYAAFAVVVEKATIVRLHLSSHHPLQELFRRAVAAFVPT